jgi:hypothetical protein
VEGEGKRMRNIAGEKKPTRIIEGTREMGEFGNGTILMNNFVSCFSSGRRN